MKNGEDYISKLGNIFLKWTPIEPTIKLFKNVDPESFKHMIDLEWEIGRLVALDSYTICNGRSKCSIVVFAEELNSC